MSRNQPKICEACGAKFAYLYNPKTGKNVPVNWDTMDAEEKKGYFMGEVIPYKQFTNSAPPLIKHVSHFKTCTDPNRFSRRKQNANAN